MFYYTVGTVIASIFALSGGVLFAAVEVDEAISQEPGDCFVGSKTSPTGYRFEPFESPA
jgi:hypothetical protein